MIDHDGLFKKLLTTFFVEFLALFFPQMREELDEESIHFLDKEFFTDLATGERREADIVVKAKFRDKDSFLIINIENQGDPKDFAQRLFFYFAYLYQKFRLPVYPIAVFYGKAPKKQIADFHRLEFSDGVVLDFHFRAVQLNRLNWRDFVKQKNPVASALMAKMNIAPKERPLVKLECLRLLTNLKIDKARMKLISVFVDSYLNLSAQEEQIFQAELAKIEPRKKEKIMEFTTSWERRGIEKGVKQGKQEGALKLVLRMLERRVGTISPATQKRIAQLSLPQLERLGIALLDFSDLADLTKWLEQRAV